MIPSFGPQSE
uniref:Uncharacterized protein n=1 Tax=Anguilla anguilla TaxID=7936 RepID=A0A0E9UN64_ANGAN